jgi:glutathione synthase/RimK-type ligase-like ATP-grasp enzyme
VDVALELEKAREFLDRGDFAQAQKIYIAVLLQDRYHHDGMLGLGEVFIGIEDYRAASIVLEQAAKRHPASAKVRSSLGVALVEFGDLAGARAAFEASLAIDPTQRKPWAGLGVLFERAGDFDSADRAWYEAFRSGSAAISTYRGEGEPIRVLLLRSSVGGNIPIDPVLDDRIFQWITFFAESFHEGMTIPAYDVVFNTIGDADLCTRPLERAEMTLLANAAPIINLPARVRATGRTQIAERVRTISGITTPRMRAIRRSELTDDRGLGWPLLVRPPGFHSGEHFAKVDDQSTMRDALEALPGEDVLAIEYLDTRGDDGMYRKYRVLTIDGNLYPSHLAISPDWKVHYFSAQHGEAEEREEQAFLADMESVIGTAALRAIEQAAELLALDYGGFDFSIDRTGRVVLFEANATMRMSTKAQIDAARAMIMRRAGK